MRLQLPHRIRGLGTGRGGAGVVVVDHARLGRDVEVVRVVGIPLHRLDVAFDAPSRDFGIGCPHVCRHGRAIVATAQQHGGLAWVPGDGADLVGVVGVGFGALRGAEIPELGGFVGGSGGEQGAMVAVCG